MDNINSNYISTEETVAQNTNISNSQQFNVNYASTIIEPDGSVVNVDDGSNLTYIRGADGNLTLVGMLNVVTINSTPATKFLSINTALDLTLTSTDAVVQGSQKLAFTISKVGTKVIPLEKVPILGKLSVVALGITTGHKLYEAISDPRGHWVDGVEAIGTLGVAVFAPEFLLGYSLVVTGIDLYRDNN